MIERGFQVFIEEPETESSIKAPFRGEANDSLILDHNVAPSSELSEELKIQNSEKFKARLSELSEELIAQVIRDNKSLRQLDLREKKNIS
ncbi:uncharacterized protein VTP21DRAFT_9746 [Calcarisporiella thermophila]|uniref:uncharacterized protein n=1 Tax=Calcarisporiella thermophila TaxID=911321 RepID=UPI003742A841